MTAPLPPMPPRSSALQRWGPVAAIVAVIAVVAGIALAGGGGGDDSASPGGTGGDGGGGGAAIPVQYHQAEADGTTDDHEWGDDCDPETGRLRIPTVYAPPCVPVFDGDNGGETYPGVSGETIKIVNYVPAQNNDLLATLQGKLDDPENVRASRIAYLEMLTDLYETYGRRIELIDFQATGAGDDETAAVADARQVAKDIGAFASLGGPILTGAYAQELARNGVLCIGCGQANPDRHYQENAPYWWGSQASPEQFLLILGDFVANRLNGRPAEFAGSEELRAKQRVFGVAHFEQEVPVFGELNEEVARRGAERGYETTVRESYTLDFAAMPQRAASIIAKMKEQGVTTIIFLGDPIMPIYLTQAATAQDYYPEWIVTGTVLTDTAALGRLYDQSQWRHAFGLSSLPARQPREHVDAWRLHEWYFGEPPAAVGTSALVYAPLAQLMLGIHLAGPTLTPETFRDGLFASPVTGGGPTTPQISYGDHGFFEAPDFLGIDDMTEIWWDADHVGADEQGVEAAGAYRYVDGGARYLPGEMPADEVRAFDPEGTVLVYEETPEDERPPQYPAPERGAGCPPAGCSPVG